VRAAEQTDTPQGSRLIAEFLSSWTLFENSWLAGWLLAVLLPILGVMVVARDQIFVGAAISQASMLGIAAGLELGTWQALAAMPWARSDSFLSVAAGALAVLAAVATTRWTTAQGPSPESVTGWIFLLGGSGAVLLLAHSPHGMEQIHRLLASTIIGAQPLDVKVLSLLLAVTGIVLWRWHQTVLLLAIDPDFASAIGISQSRWSLGLAAWLGAVLGLSNRVAGVPFTFGVLLLPALIARTLCREVSLMFLVAPVVGLASCVVAFVLAHGLDYPPGQMTTGLLCLLLPVAWALRRLRR
jgi:ABC-type Mn2+/Zn2+ transport system permease subunit